MLLPPRRSSIRLKGLGIYPRMCHITNVDNMVLMVHVPEDDGKLVPPRQGGVGPTPSEAATGTSSTLLNWPRTLPM